MTDPTPRAGDRFVEPFRGKWAAHEWTESSSEDGELYPVRLAVLDSKADADLLAHGRGELARLRAELDRWQELYGADDPQDGVATMAVGKIVGEQERELKRLRAALKPFADYAAVLDENKHPDAMRIAYYRETSPTVGDCRAARDALAGRAAGGEGP